jgi:protein phosphatase
VSGRFALRTDVGLVRENNEDYATVSAQRGLYVVADGMGGHLGGEVASRVAVETLASHLCAHPRPRRIADEQIRLAEAVGVANQAVLRESLERRLFGMGTTLTALLLRGRTATLAHIGDSRAYLLREGELFQLTGDHTVIRMLVEAGEMDAADAHAHPDRHLLTQALGTADLVRPDIVQTRLPKGSRILLSTDGLHDVVPSGELAALSGLPGLQKAADALIEAARSHGAPDNITALLVGL